MNKYTVALCYGEGTAPSLLENVRARISSFGYRAEYLVNSLVEQDETGTNVLRLGRGYDLVVVLTDCIQPNTKFSFLNHFNHVIEDPWGMCAIVIFSSSTAGGPQPTIEIESQRSIAHLLLKNLPPDLFELLANHRYERPDRDLSENEWRSIKNFVTAEEWRNIIVLRGK